MSVLNQKTINKDITLKGIGLHSGMEATIVLKPAEPNSGIVFKRTDIEENNIVIPNIFNVSSAVFCTTISNENGVCVSTIEHLMGALYGLGIDNLLIEIDNQEVPILDIASTNSFADPSKIGTSWLSISTNTLSIPIPYKAPIKCSIVEILTFFSFEIVVQKFALLTLKTFGITILLSLMSVL